MEGLVIWPRRITKKGLSKQTLTMYKHGFSNPMDISLLVFIYALEGMSFNGTRLRQQRSSKLLKNVSISCYAMFPIWRSYFSLASRRYLYLVLRIRSSNYFFSLMLLKVETSIGDFLEAEDPTAQLFIDMIGAWEDS